MYKIYGFDLLVICPNRLGECVNLDERQVRVQQQRGHGTLINFLSCGPIHEQPSGEADID